MKIALDISQIVYEGTGVARFTKGLVESILKFDERNDWLFFFSSLRNSLPDNLRNKILSKNFELKEFKLPPTLLSLFWNQLHVIDVKNFIGDFDWFISSDWTEPPAAQIKKATVVHDLVYLRYPETVDKKILSNQKKRLSWVKKESSIIFSDSESTKRDLIKLLKIPDEKIKVIYPGIDTDQKSAPSIKETLNKYRLNKSFILTVGKIEPRKNISRLINAFSKLDNRETDLVIVGPQGWDKTVPFKENIKYLGFVNDDELMSLYKSCLFFIYPSIWEGFGYPVVEAMKLGVPVATSNTSSLAEISHDAALLFNPYDVNSIKKALTEMIENKKFRMDLIQKGKKQVVAFTWKNYYEKFIHSLT